ncbi:MAG: VacJ family lipoprotein [Acetobacteraceae bacterium]|nr:VacJ family lipoprotein [Acetobacteraceae bacterium]
MSRHARLAAILLLASALPAAAAPDPLEGVNRRVHAFNEAVRITVAAQLVRLWQHHVPAPVRQGAAGTLATLGEPVTAAAALAAGELGTAGNAAARFGINATLGLGGWRDPASAMGYPRRAFTLADAACRWGVPSGPYLVLPLLGPSTLRDAGAQAASAAALAQLLGAEAMTAWGGAEAFLGYAALHAAAERLRAESLDAYAAQRSAFLQRRAATCPSDRVPDEAD